METPANQQQPVKPPVMPKKNNFLSLVLKLVLIALLSIVVVFIYTFTRNKTKPPQPNPSPVSFDSLNVKEFRKFGSEQEFIDYLANGGEGESAYFGLGITGEKRISMDTANAPTAQMAPEGMGAGGGPERVSETNVQVAGIDEPDIVKTDGKELYFSSDRPITRMIPVSPGRNPQSATVYPDTTNMQTKTIKAFPPDQLAKDGEIDKTGQLLLNKNMLLVFVQGQENGIYGYDVTDPKNPSEKWKISFKQNDWLQTARLYNGKVYFVTQTNINRSRPCPYIPLTVGSAEYSIQCTDIYYSKVDMPVNTTYNAFILNPQTGQIEKSTSFVGSTGETVIYMSPQALYTTYSYSQDVLGFMDDFFSEKGQDLVPSELLQRLDKIRDYDLSTQAKMVEFQQILQEHLNSLSDDDRLKFENEMQNRLSDYAQEHMREFQRLGIVKISLGDFSVSATGDIPGRPLNQFSLDEYQGNLRIATTVGERMYIANPESANDVYILDNNLNPRGSVKDLGLGERIYSARFIAGKAYLVTFRQTDPFYVLDLSDPGNPKVSGELKIPGFSSYLHPLKENLILGVGQDQNKVKLSLFDVSNPQDPREVSKYLLDEYWTDVQDNHHAFLQDDKHEVFFLPGSKGGYIFSYSNDDILLKKAVSNIQARRAIYIDNYMYIIGDNKIVVLDENNWEEVKSLDL